MNEIMQTRLVPVAVIDDVADAVPLAEALREGGVNLIEVTFRTEAAEDSIRAIRQALPDMLVGAGTLLDVYQVERAVRAGAQFGVSPGLSESVVLKALSMEIPFVPGVMTPSDVEKGLALGCSLMKFFPAGAAGGIPMLKALAGPYFHTGVKFIPLGGINGENAKSYLDLPLVAAVGGTWFLDKKAIAAKDWAQVAELTRAAVAVTRP